LYWVVWAGPLFTVECRLVGSIASLDECKDWSDQAAVLASYARHADDGALQKLAMRIQSRCPALRVNC
jgi:hypothetical protein